MLLTSIPFSLWWQKQNKMEALGALIQIAGQMTIKDHYETAGICVICIILHYTVLYYITSPQIGFEPEQPIQVVYVSANSFTLFPGCHVSNHETRTDKGSVPLFKFMSHSVI